MGDEPGNYGATGWRDGAPGWVKNESLLDSIYQPVTDAVIGAADLGPNLRALDVGCGTGTLLLAGTQARAAMVGVDVAPDMVEAARLRVPAATVLLGDAETIDIGMGAPGAPFERVVSRFGVMFFGNPTAAFTNIRSFTAPDARMVFACWRGVDENPTFGGAGSEIFTQALPDPPTPPKPGQPGPMAFADRDYLAGILRSAGWSNVSIDSLDASLDHGVDGSDGVEERLTTIMAFTTGRLAREQLTNKLSEEQWSELLDQSRESIRTYIAGGSVKLPGAMWLVRATNRQ